LPSGDSGLPKHEGKQTDADVASMRVGTVSTRSSLTMN